VTHRLSAITLATFALHFAWEMGQMPLFTPMDRLPFWQGTAWCARAAGWDMVISAAAYLAAALAARTIQWPRQRSASPLAIYFLVGIGTTIAIELWALSVGRWQYREGMPTVAGVGLAPLTQWILIPAVIVLILRRTTRMRS
jgi:hypothetical protein